MAEATVMTSAPSGAAASEVLAYLYFEHYGPLVRMITLAIGDSGEAEDVVQDAYLRLFRAWPRLRDHSVAPTYLRTTAFNLARSRLRQLRSARRHSDERPEIPHPEDIAVLGERQDALIKALHLLPRRQRECLVLRYYSELTDREVADTLGVSPGSVKQHIHRGLRKLETTLEAHR